MQEVDSAIANLIESGQFVPTKPSPPTGGPSAPPVLLAMPSLESTQTTVTPPKPQRPRRRKTSAKRPSRPAATIQRSSVMRGVTRHTRTGRFDAHLWCDGRQWYLGAFTSELLAGAAYDVAALKMRPGELPLNLPADRYKGNRLGHLLNTVRLLGLDDWCSTFAQLTVEEVLEATRYASKKRDVFARPDAAAFGSDVEAMLALLLHAFETVAEGNGRHVPHEDDCKPVRVLTRFSRCTMFTGDCCR